MKQREKAHVLVRELQELLFRRMNRVAGEEAMSSSFEKIEWLRDGGVHGGGSRYVCESSDLFGRAAINVSHIHYDDLPEKKLGSATALSTILHPAHPLAPSLHMHISWTEMKAGTGGWRVMADLNPAIPSDAQTAIFTQALKDAAPKLADAAMVQGDRYFWIPALKRHRGVAHFYLEGHDSGDREADRMLARGFGEAVAECYGTLLEEGIANNQPPTEDQTRAQLDYHSAYFFQVLTLDRGTTSGLLVHDQNDIGILGSLPQHVDRELLSSWQSRLPSPQDALLGKLCAALPSEVPTPVTDKTRGELAAIVRDHYRDHPEALALQAASYVATTTVENHR